MNERIKELAEQAGIDFFNSIDVENSGRQYCEAWTEQQEKFAELIVSKCIELMDENYRGDMYTGDVFASEYNNCINEQVQVLEDYFGVKK
jgi:hypothetical protein